METDEGALHWCFCVYCRSGCGAMMRVRRRPGDELYSSGREGGSAQMHLRRNWCSHARVRRSDFFKMCIVFCNSYAVAMCKARLMFLLEDIMSSSFSRSSQPCVRGRCAVAEDVARAVAMVDCLCDLGGECQSLRARCLPLTASSQLISNAWSMKPLPKRTPSWRAASSASCAACGMLLTGWRACGRVQLRSICARLSTVLLFTGRSTTATSLSPAACSSAAQVLQVSLSLCGLWRPAPEDESPAWQHARARHAVRRVSGGIRNR